jgi:predicted amidohydrolase
VNSPPTRGLGGSSYWSANGRLLAQAPMDAAGLAVIDSDGHGLHWHPLPGKATPKALSA